MKIIFFNRSGLSERLGGLAISKICSNAQILQEFGGWQSAKGFL
jgi:hypothetical protein